MIPRFKPDFSLAELTSIFIFPKENIETLLEKKISKLMKQKYTIFLPYGRTSLIFLLEALNIKNKEIICPAYTCVVVSHAIVKSGNIPIFVDSTEKDFNMNWEEVENLITHKTAAVISTSIFGYPVDLDKQRHFSSKFRHIEIIQDCAHSFSAKWNGQEVQQFGKAAFFGANISKIITTVFGGFITTNEHKLYQQIIKIKSQNIKDYSLINEFKKRFYLFLVWFAFNDFFYYFVNKFENWGLLNKYVKYYDENKIDMPYDYLSCPTKIQSQVGYIQCSKFHKIISDRVKIAKYYDENIIKSDTFQLPPIIEGSTYSHYVPRTKYKKEFIKFAKSKGIQIGDLIEYSIPYLEAYRQFNHNKVKYPISKRLSEETVNLPISIKGSLSKAKKVVSVVNSFILNVEPLLEKKHNRYE